VKTLYNISCVGKDGFRRLATPNQGRHFQERRWEAEGVLAATLVNNSRGRLVTIYGDEEAVDSLRVDPFTCYENGDAQGIFVHEVNKEGMELLEWILAAQVPPSRAARAAWEAGEDPTEHRAGAKRGAVPHERNEP
jgi:hypothetical protein